MRDYLFHAYGSMAEAITSDRTTELNRVSLIPEEELLAKDPAVLAAPRVESAFATIPTLPRGYTIERGRGIDQIRFRLATSEDIGVLNLEPAASPTQGKPFGIASGKEIVFDIPAENRSAEEVEQEAQENIERIHRWADTLREEIDNAREELLADLTAEIAARRDAVKHTRSTLDELGGSQDRGPEPQRPW